MGLAQFALLVCASFFTILMYLLPSRWGSNEYHYISQVVFGSEENRGVFAAGIPNSTAHLFDFIASGLVNLVSVETATVLLRLAGFLVISLGLGAVAHAIKMGPVALAMGLTAFLLLGQTYFGGEWIFNGIESKVFAYGFGLLSLGGMLLQRRLMAYSFSLIAVFFHPLVGLMFLAITTLTGFFVPRTRGPKFEKVLKSAIVATAISYPGWLRWQTLSADGADSDLARMIYTVVRHPHHVAPFGGTHPINGSEVGGWFSLSDLVFPGVVFLSLFLALRFAIANSIRVALKVSLLLHAWVPTSFLLAWLDRDTQYFGALYLFRPMSAILLLSSIAFLAFIFEKLRFGLVKEFALAIFLSWALLGSPGPGQIGPMPKFVNLTPLGQSVVDMISSETGERETILVDFAGIQEQTGLDSQTFEMATKRGQVSVYKFVPTRDEDILLWWDAETERTEILSGRCNPAAVALWDYFLLQKSNVPDEVSSEIVAVEGGIALVKLNPSALQSFCPIPKID